MRINQITSIEEVKMSPSTFARAIDTAGSDVKVGYEFEFVVPSAKTKSNNDLLTNNKMFVKRYWNKLPKLIDRIHEIDHAIKLSQQKTQVKSWNQASYLFAKQLKAQGKAILEKAKSFESSPRWNRWLTSPRKKYRKLSPDFSFFFDDDRISEQLAKIINKLLPLTQAESFSGLSKEQRNLIQSAQVFIDSVPKSNSTIVLLNTLCKFLFNMTWDEIGNQDNILDYVQPNWQSFENLGDDSDEEYISGVSFLSGALQSSLNITPDIFMEYHQEPKSKNLFYLEPDGSIESPNGHTGVELVTPPMPIKDASKLLDGVFAIAARYKLQTNSSTGLHINIDIPESFNLLKMMLFLDDKYVLQTFKRENNEFAKSLINALQNYRFKYFGKNPSITKRTKSNLQVTSLFPGTTKIPADALEKMINYLSGHHSSVELRKNYLSLRSPGGDYLKKIPEIKQTLGRLAQAVQIASDPNLYKQEYLKKLAQLVDEIQGPDVSRLQRQTALIPNSKKRDVYNAFRKLTQVKESNKVPVVRFMGYSRNPNAPKAKIMDFISKISYIKKATVNTNNPKHIKEKLISEIKKSTNFKYWPWSEYLATVSAKPAKNFFIQDFYPSPRSNTPYVQREIEEYRIQNSVPDPAGWYYPIIVQVPLNTPEGLAWLKNYAAEIKKMRT